RRNLKAAVLAGVAVFAREHRYLPVEQDHDFTLFRTRMPSRGTIILSAHRRQYRATQNGQEIEPIVHSFNFTSECPAYQSMVALRLEPGRSLLATTKAVLSA